MSVRAAVRHASRPHGGARLLPRLRRRVCRGGGDCSCRVAQNIICYSSSQFEPRQGVDWLFARPWLVPAGVGLLGIVIIAALVLGLRRARSSRTLVTRTRAAAGGGEEAASIISGEAEAAEDAEEEVLDFSLATACHVDTSSASGWCEAKVCLASRKLTSI